MSTKYLSNIIQAEIAKSGVISFAKYMQLALYHPEYGYYMNAKEKLGKNGDFTTAPEIGVLFAKCLANQIAEIHANRWLASKSAPQQQLNATTATDLNILEFGAGSGKLAIDLISELHNLGFEIANYTIIDVSPSLIKLQKQNISEYKTKIRTKTKANKNISTNFIWSEEIPNKFTGIIIANELFDAMPVNCFKIKQNKMFELGVGYNNQDQNFCWQEKAINENSELLQAVKNLHLNANANANANVNLDLSLKLDLDSGADLDVNHINENYATDLNFNAQSNKDSANDYAYTSEINLNLNCFFKSLDNKVDKAIMLFIDYGFKKQEYYHSDRNTGTLMCHYKHKASTDPLSFPGLQDITAHVDFSYVKAVALQNSCDFLGYTTLANFLIGSGLIDILEKKATTCVSLQEINLLTSPAEMGELFKVIAFAKGLEHVSSEELNLRGFSFKNLTL